MTLEQVKEKLEGVKWINKEIEGLYLELAALESGIIKKQELSNTRVQTSQKILYYPLLLHEEENNERMRRNGSY
ncbi:hypothetical protein RQ174_04420 [Streptococcus pneumoniae]|nr:hypothetical protein [Streptococcus pneumoniae]MDT5769530.1 hypothetical protein [Streptococcus pneumoniae]VPW67762.1 phage protein [Streptococcus pneumoniae]